MDKLFALENYDYSLPEGSIAQRPLKDRASSKMLVLGKNSGNIRDSRVSSLADFLKPGDCLVINNSKVIPARLRGTTATGAKVEILLVENTGSSAWEAMMKNSRRVKPGAEVMFVKGLRAKLLEKKGKTVTLDFNMTGKSFMNILEAAGETPLPPYITANALSKTHRKRYQTVYAKEPGSSAAPTAGLHFTKKLLDRIKNAGVKVAEVTLHVGPGTFEPVMTPDIRHHAMHREIFSVTPQAAETINSAQRVIAAGTTSLRVLETAADNNGRIRPGSGKTGIFIYPGYRFKAVQGLLTNFHLPKSTLLMLVCAFAGHENTLNAYRHAISHKYRFFSYGDAMLIL